MRKPVMHKSRSSAAPPRPPAPGEGKRGTEGYLGYLLRQAAVAYRTRLERALAELEVTQPQFAVLTMVAAYPGLSNADLARLSLLTPQTVSVIVANLKRSGLLASQPHAVHGRIRQLALTSRGEKSRLSMPRKSGHRFSEKDMRERKSNRAGPSSSLRDKPAPRCARHRWRAGRRCHRAA
jgi:DNA-binding MarR family transcriptional regulator